MKIQNTHRQQKLKKLTFNTDFLAFKGVLIIPYGMKDPS